MDVVVWLFECWAADCEKCFFLPWEKVHCSRVRKTLEGCDASTRSKCYRFKILHSHHQCKGMQPGVCWQGGQVCGMTIERGICLTLVSERSLLMVYWVCCHGEAGQGSESMKSDLSAHDNVLQVVFLFTCVACGNKHQKICV